MEKRQTFDFWSLRRPKELSDCGRSSPAFESLGRQFEPARAERTSSSGLAEAGESQNCLSRKRGRKTIKRGLRVSRPLVLEKNGGEFLFHSHFFALSLAPVVSLSPGSHLVRARSLCMSVDVCVSLVLALFAKKIQCYVNSGIFVFNIPVGI